MFYAQRNDTLINLYNRTNSIGQLRNIDINAYTSSNQVAEYLAKYVTKVEERTKTMYELCQLVILKISTNTPILSLVAKVLNKLIRERDVLSQEIYYKIIALPLTRVSRIVISIDYRPIAMYKQVIKVNRETSELIVAGLLVLQKYIQRLDTIQHDYPDLTLFGFLQNQNYTKKDDLKPRLKARNRILKFFPDYDKSNKLQQEDFYRTKIVLQYPFTAYLSLLYQFLNGDGTQYNTQKATLDAYRKNYTYRDNYFSRAIKDKFDKEFKPKQYDLSQESANQELLTS